MAEAPALVLRAFYVHHFFGGKFGYVLVHPHF